MTFRVSWDEGRSGERRTRRCETADEARGFIRGLRVHPDHTNISLRRVAEDGQLEKLKVAELFESAASESAAADPEAVEPEAASAAPEEPASGTLAALATALVDEAEIAPPIVAALAVVEKPEEPEPAVAAVSGPANDPHPAPAPAPKPASQSQATSMLLMAKRWM